MSAFRRLRRRNSKSWRRGQRDADPAPVSSWTSQAWDKLAFACASGTGSVPRLGPESPWPGGCLAHHGDRPLDSRDRGGDAVASSAAWGPTRGLSSAWGHTGGGALARVWGGHLPHPRVPCHRPLPRRLPQPLPGSVISGEPDAWFLPVRVRGEGSGVGGRAAKGKCLNGTGARAPSGGSHGKKGGAGELRAFLRG